MMDWTCVFGRNAYLNGQLIGYVGTDSDGNGILFVGGKEFCVIDEEGRFLLDGLEIGYIDDGGDVYLNGQLMGEIDSHDDLRLSGKF